MSPLLARLAGATVLVLTALLPLPAGAAPLVPGAPAPVLQFIDQHEQPVRVDRTTRVLIFAADRAASDLAQAVLKAQPAGVLGRLQAVYLADISAMPSLITQMFALPKLRELPFAVGLVRDAAQTEALPRQAGRVTVLRLDGGRVVSIEHAEAAAALLQALKLEPR